MGEEKERKCTFSKEKGCSFMRVQICFTKEREGGGRHCGRFYLCTELGLKGKKNFVLRRMFVVCLWPRQQFEEY